jgi:solute carrier family 35 (UDP-sugar transporter), member A1/2/3
MSRECSEFWFPYFRCSMHYLLLSRRLVTLAGQNSLLTIVMHYSRVSTPPSRAYSAAAAVLLNELLKGIISLAIAFASMPSQQEPIGLVGTKPMTLCPGRLTHRCRRLKKELFSPDCWKLSIPAILYGRTPHLSVPSESLKPLLQ